MHATRRNFLTTSTLVITGCLAAPILAMPNQKTNPEDLYLIGPKDGFTPHIGTMLSMMTMMRAWVIRQVEDLTVEQLDFQIDEQSNSIGAMLSHLAATERYYQLNTFDGIPWGEWDQSLKDQWDVPMGLGEDGRKKLTGKPAAHYLEQLKNVRQHTIDRFKELDDDWLMQSEPFFGLSSGVQGQTNNYCKWFHVCEHESNHNGQIKFIKKRFDS